MTSKYNNVLCTRLKKPKIMKYAPMCPCSDHVFKLARMGKFITVDDALEYIKKLEPGESMRCLTTRDCDMLDAMSTLEKENILRICNDCMLWRRGVLVMTTVKPMFVLATYAPHLHGRSILCTRKHRTPSCTAQLLWDFRHLDIVRRTYAELMLDQQYILLPDDKTTLLAKYAIIRVIMDNFDANFTNKNPFSPIQQYAIVRACSRDMQDLLQRGRVSPASPISWVPKDVIKIIHKMIFDGYMKPVPIDDAVYDW
jgi:hypothetical protein